MTQPKKKPQSYPRAAAQPPAAPLAKKPYAPAQKRTETPTAPLAKKPYAPAQKRTETPAAPFAKKPYAPAQKRMETPAAPFAKKPYAPAQKRTETPAAPLAKKPYAPAQKRMDTPRKPAPEGQCPIYKRCGGCQLQNMAYPEQLRWKQILVERLLAKFHAVSPIIGMKTPYHYRNKVQAAFALNRDRKVISGVYQSSTERVVAVDHCLTENKKADAIIVSIRKLMQSFKMLPYNMDSGMGFMRHVLVKCGFASGQIMVVLVTASPIFPAKKRFVEALRKQHPEITTILQNVNTYQTNLLLGDVEKILFGPGTIEDTLCGCVFRISAKSFYQINPIQTEILYEKAIAFAGLTGTETVIDAYCGIGTIGLIASKHAGNVIGVEVNKDAVRDAIANARRNKIENVYFHNADAGQLMTAMAAEGKTADVVFMDPPRAGSDESFLCALVALAPRRVVYISCNPETQERDVVFLTRHGYRITEIQPVDMFPHTNHVECVVKLCRVEK